MREMLPSPTMTQTSKSINGVQKEKKTRRRLRLSCVECTKRRQKCDRKYPCSLCISRGVSHLCRWESVPVARPTPQRPPVIPSHGQDPLVQGLVARIATLEQALEEHRSQQLRLVATKKLETFPDTFLNSPSSGSSTFASADAISPSISPSPILSNFGLPSVPKEDDDKDRSLTTSVKIQLKEEVYATTSALAQLSFGHHGEFVGRGSLICALHSLSSGPVTRFLYASSTNAASAYRDTTDGLSSITPADREELIQSLPPKPMATAFIHRFFAQYNWRYGIPEQWFQAACTQMWNTLEYPSHHSVHLNANWLSLFFSMLAIAANNSDYDATHIDDSRGLEHSDKYFMCAMKARRIAEEDYLNKPNVSLMASAADGTVLGCLAVPVLCCYLAQRGRASEAWKLVGRGIRNAEAVGMHRDPEWARWQVMSKDEMAIRRIAWWQLVIWDRMYAYLLGRPHTVRNDTVDVGVPPYIEADGSTNYINRGLVLFIQLAEIAGETLEKCFAIRDPTSNSLFELDDKFQLWEDNLPPEYQLKRDEHATENISQADLMTIDQQRYTLITWYLMCRAKLHLVAITGSGRFWQQWADIEENRRRCILICMRQIRLQCDTHAAAVQRRAHHGGDPLPGNHWFFEGCISLIEASVVLLSTITRHPWKEKVKEAVELVDRAMVVFTQVVRGQTGKQGEIARMAVKVLGTLREEDWWKAQVLSASKYQDTTIPAAPVLSDSKSFSVYDTHSYARNLHSSSVQTSPRYNPSRMGDISGGIDYTPDPSSEGDHGAPESRDVRMVDLLTEVEEP